MKKRLLNVLKIFFIIMGVLFLLQLLIGLGIILGLVGFANADIDYFKIDDKKLKTMQPIIKQLEEYKKQLGVYPDNIEKFKIKKDLNYEYTTTKDKNCYTLTIKTKNNKTQQYQHCSFNTQNSTSNSQSYVEYSE